MLLHFKNVRNFPKWFKLLVEKAHWSERSAKINRQSKRLPALKNVRNFPKWFKPLVEKSYGSEPFRI
jgi:hypothetical protein